MRICILGNMNLTHYVLAKLLRKKGIDARLFLYDSDAKGHLPEYEDSSLKDNYPEWIKQLRWGSWWSFRRTPAGRMRRDLGGGDLYVACGGGPAFLSKGGITNFIFLAYGSDLYQCPFWRQSLKAYGRPVLKALFFLPTICLSSRQKRAISRSLAVDIVPIPNIRAESIQQLGMQKKAIPLSYPMDLGRLDPTAVRSESIRGQDQMLKELALRRRQFEFVVFSPTRHVWCRPMPDPASNKGNDILLLGVAEAISKEAVNPLLALIEKGKDVPASKALITKLGIANNVLWIPQTSRENLRYYYSVADVVADEFFWDSGAPLIALEALSLGKPLLIHMSHSYERVAQRPSYPCLNVRTPGEIRSVLTDFAGNKEKYRDIGRKGRDWVEKYYGDGLVDEYIRLFEHILSGKDVAEFRLTFEER